MLFFFGVLLTVSWRAAFLPYFSAFFWYLPTSSEVNPRPAARSLRFSLAASHTESAEPMTAPAAGTILSL